MSSSRQLHLGAFMRPVSIHRAAWRYPGGSPDANFNFQHLKRFAQALEHGRFVAFFESRPASLHYSVRHCAERSYGRLIVRAGSITSAHFDRACCSESSALGVQHGTASPVSVNPNL